MICTNHDTLLGDAAPLRDPLEGRSHRSLHSPVFYFAPVLSRSDLRSQRLHRIGLCPKHASVFLQGLNSTPHVQAGLFFGGGIQASIFQSLRRDAQVV